MNSLIKFISVRISFEENTENGITRGSIIIYSLELDKEIKFSFKIMGGEEDIENYHVEIMEEKEIIWASTGLNLDLNKSPRVLIIMLICLQAIQNVMLEFSPYWKSATNLAKFLDTNVTNIRLKREFPAFVTDKQLSWIFDKTEN